MSIKKVMTMFALLMGIACATYAQGVTNDSTATAKEDGLELVKDVYPQTSFTSFSSSAFVVAVLSFFTSCACPAQTMPVIRANIIITFLILIFTLDLVVDKI